MGDNVKVSIIMPSLNVVDYIDEAIKSVRNQSLIDIEILCIDAGSTDGTMEIINNNAKEDSRIKIIHSQMRSYGHQINIGIDFANGDYIGIVETDDYVVGEMYKKLYSLAVRYDLDYVKADYKAFISQDDGDYFYLTRKNFKDESLYNVVLRPKEHTEIATGDWYNWQGIYKTEYLRKNRIYCSETPGAAFQDIGFLFYSIINATRAMYIKDSFYRYRIDRDGASSNSGKCIKYSYDEFKRLIDISGKHLDEKDWRVLYARMVKSFVSSYRDLLDSPIKLDEQVKESYYRWFKETVCNALSEKLLKEGDIDVRLWNSMNALLDSEKSLTRYQDIGQQRIKEFLADWEDSQILIFGCGNYGLRAINILKKLNIVVSYFLDNNNEIWGKKLKGVPIIAPKDLKITGKTKVIIANEIYHEEIRQQLLSMGLSGDELFVLGGD